MFSSVDQAPGAIMLKELTPPGSTVMYLDVDVVSRPIFKCFKLKLENCLQNKSYLEYTHFSEIMCILSANNEQ